MSFPSHSRSKGSSNTNFPIQSTAGAVPVRNDKGEVSMQKVKVTRYIPGKRPDYAPRSSSEEQSDEEEFIVPNRMKKKNEEEDIREPEVEYSEKEREDPRLRRLQQLSEQRRYRSSSSDSEGEEERPGRHRDSDSGSESEEEDVANIEKRRALLRQKALEKIEEDEVLMKEEEKSSSSEESESDYEEYTDSEEESAPRLKPVFVRKVQRITIKADPNEEKVKYDELVKKQEQKRVETLKLVEAEIIRDKSSGKAKDEEAMANMPQLTDVNTDDENEEADYEAWKLRELKRIKRDREEREAIEREKQEIERMHNMTEEERRLELKLNPKVVLNKAAKGKYKFLQKYYHRGVFYLDKEEDVLTRDYAQPTLEDHFDKSVLPKVMQVKNFGRSGRTKYTHLVDQDTTNFESPWVHETTTNVKFHSTQAGGVRQTFEKPSAKCRKLDLNQGPS